MPDHEYSRNVVDLADPDAGGPSRRPRRGATQPRPAREFTVYTSMDDPGTEIRANRVDTLGDWFTLYLDGQEVYGAPREKVLQYKVAPLGEVA